jgi:translation initiation factor 1 (eIF-1/SUI1)
MKKSKRVSQRRPAAKRAWLFACALLVAGVATAAATYASRNAQQPKAERATTAAAAAQPADPFVTVEVGGRKVRVNAQTLQQGPLTQAEAEQLAEQLEGNKATEGLVEEKHEDGSVSVDLQGRFQNVVLAKRNDDGTVAASCVDTPEAARDFLTSRERSPSLTGTGAPRKAALGQ